MGNSRITGAVKFFEQSVSLLKNGASATATSNEDSINSVLDIRNYTRWESLGSNDSTSEVITVSFRSSVDIDSLFLTLFNFKDFDVKYFNGTSFVDFSNVVGVNGVETSGIVETDYSRPTAFYQFDKVNTNRIQITINSTQIADQDKFLSRVICCEEIGTLRGFPRVSPESMRNETKARVLSKKYLVQKTYETVKVKINFKTHPFQEDADLMQEVFDREESFLIYPCGGRSGTNYFKVEQNNWKLNDVYNVQLTGKLKNEHEKGVYLLGFNKSVTFEEHV